MNRLSVYRVSFDVQRYRSLVFDVSSEDWDEIPDLDGRCRLAIDWPHPPVRLDNKKAPSPDVWHLTSMGRALVMTPPVVERLEPFVSMAGELLPLRNNTDEEWEFLVLNVLIVLDHQELIDVSMGAEERRREVEMAAEIERKEATTADEREDIEETVLAWREGEVWPVLYPAFIAEHLPEKPTLFRIDRLASSLFLCDQDDSSDTLLRRIERLQLTGLRLTRVWSTDTGPEEINLFRPESFTQILLDAP